jgi:hypothetical protein
MREVKVEDHLRELVEAAGGICEKHVAPGRIGVPDRLVTWPWGEMDLVETKAPGKGARTTQTTDHRERAKRGVPVYLLDTKAKVNTYVHVRCAQAPWSEAVVKLLPLWSVPLG